MLVKYVKEGLGSETLSMRRGRLDKKILPSLWGLDAVPTAKSHVVAWTEKVLNQSPLRASVRGGSTDSERLLKVENERLKNGILSLKLILTMPKQNSRNWHLRMKR